MPNHVTNNLVLEGPVDDVAALKQLLITKVPAGWSTMSPDGTPVVPEPIDGVDFNRITPMPPLLDKVISPIRKGENGRIMLYSNDNPLVSHETREATEEEQRILDSIPEGDWYNWSINNWGTKWNAYDFRPISDHARYEFSFDTAWSPPTPIFNELAQRFPLVSIGINWFDEGWCHAGSGFIGHTSATQVSEDLYCEPSNRIYEKVYGTRPLTDEEYEREYATEFATADQLRIAENFSTPDALAASDAQGYFPITAVIHSDDEELDEDYSAAVRAVGDSIRMRLGI